MSELVDRIVAMRKAANLGNKELDRLAGITAGHSWLIENADKKDGKRKNNLAASTVAKLAELFGCTLDYLVSGKGEPPSAEEIALAVERARSKQASVATENEATTEGAPPSAA